MEALKVLPEAVYLQWDNSVVCHDEDPRPRWSIPRELHILNILKLAALHQLLAIDCLLEQRQDLIPLEPDTDIKQFHVFGKDLEGQRTLWRGEDVQADRLKEYLGYFAAGQVERLEWSWKCAFPADELLGQLIWEKIVSRCRRMVKKFL